MAADGILAGLVFGRQALVSDAPPGIGIVAGVFLLASLACSVFAFANRSYETAPRADEIAHFAAASEDWIRWSFIGNVLGAIAANRNTLARKAHWLTAGQIFLLVSLAPLGGYFVYHSIRKVV